jgi:hypothetical protein
MLALMFASETLCLRQALPDLPLAVAQSVKRDLGLLVASRGALLELGTLSRGMGTRLRRDVLKS